MVITDAWLDRHRTAAGGWKAKQLQVIGVEWPPRAGWKRRIVGTEISDSARRVFESFGVPRDDSPTTGTLLSSPCGCSVLPWEDCQHTAGRLDVVQAQQPAQSTLMEDLPEVSPQVIFAERGLHRVRQIMALAYV